MALTSSLRATAADPQPEVVVFAAASLSDALKEIAAGYPAAHITFNFAASSLLERQIEQGAPADLFVSADEAKMDKLSQKGLLVTGTRHDLLGNSLVIVVPSDAAKPLGDPKEWAADKAGGKIMIGQPETVPAGIYAKQWLTGLGLWSALQDRLVPTENVRAALAGVEAGNAAYGIVYATDALIAKKVTVVYRVPAGQGPRIVYPLAQIVSSKPSQPAVQAFAAYLLSPVASAIFTKRGFIILAK